jgi:hypothetical protein
MKVTSRLLLNLLLFLICFSEEKPESRLRVERYVSIRQHTSAHELNAACSSPESRLHVERYGRDCPPTARETVMRWLVFRMALSHSHSTGTKSFLVRCIVQFSLEIFKSKSFSLTYLVVGCHSHHAVKMVGKGS